MMVLRLWPANRQTGDSSRYSLRIPHQVRGRLQATSLSHKMTQPLKPTETNMQYKTIVLELLKERTELHERLKKERRLLATMEGYARELKTSHQAWKKLLTQMRPDNDQSQVASEAMEIALKELEDRLPSALPRDSSEGIFLDAAMMFLRRPTSRG